MSTPSLLAIGVTIAFPTALLSFTPEECLPASSAVSSAVFELRDLCPDLLIRPLSGEQIELCFFITVSVHFGHLLYRRLQLRFL